ncbi:UPF0231 family protein, partial [Vibrio cholerae]|nr:UPF0231 family protein [Vibrio cholerae]
MGIFRSVYFAGHHLSKYREGVCDILAPL